MVLRYQADGSGKALIGSGTNGAHWLPKAVTKEGQFSSPPLFDMTVPEVARYVVPVAWMQFLDRLLEGVGNISRRPVAAYRVSLPDQYSPLLPFEFSPV
ncbi:MAG: hypothetical protein EOO81_02920 [Oxalobacteraceae bacterium]|nr:MAG: hypothetical protein EOO81_02920 [Oxalobacteraceae bacterium]